MVVLVLLNGVFSGAEIAILSVRRTRLQELVESGSGRARAVAGLRGNPERFLATVQVGITVISASAAAFSGSSVASRIAPAFAGVPGLEPYADDLAFGIVVAGVSYLSLVLGELVPKSLALRAAETYALLIGPPLAALAWATRPLIWVLTTSSNVVLRIFGDRTSFTETRMSPDELRQLVDEASSAGTIDAHIGELASRALDFDDLDVASVMVPRRLVVAIPSTTTADALARVAVDNGHARMVVYGRDLDDVVGYVNVRDALAKAHQEPGFALHSHIRPVPFLPETMRASAVLVELQRQRTHLGVVLDDQGTVQGIVTIEDLLEELVGEIYSEDEASPSWFVREADGAALIQAQTAIHDVNRGLEIELPETETYSTMAGLAIELAGRIPSAGEHFPIDGFVLEVVEASRRRVKLVRLRVADQRPPEA